jgi:Protein of unknown function (DUF3891)
MILRPLLPEEDWRAAAQLQPVWQVVSRVEAMEAEQYLLVGQPDHARLSGEMAAKFRATFLPSIDEKTARAISAHDAGWSQFPFERELQGNPPLTEGGRPQHFMQVAIDESLAAWRGSIKAAGEISPVGEYMVSGHFSRIARMRIQMEVDPGEVVDHLASFAREEEAAQEKLEWQIPLPKAQLTELIDLLQFSDVLSLYLCCGSHDPVDFPQDFRGERIQMRYEEGVFVTTPSIFVETQRFHLPVRIFPSKSGEGRTMVGFHIR